MTNKPLQLILGAVVVFVTYFPIAIVINVPFHYGHAPVPSVLIVLVTAGIQIIVGVTVMSKRQTYRSLGIGIIVGAALMTLFMFFLTPLLGP
jgi:hypothetical protein